MAEQELFTYGGVDYSFKAGLTTERKIEKIKQHLEKTKKKPEVTKSVTPPVTTSGDMPPAEKATAGSTEVTPPTITKPVVKEEESDLDKALRLQEEKSKTRKTALKKKQGEFPNGDAKIFTERYKDNDLDNPVYDADLIKDDNWISAAKIMFKMKEGREWGSDEDDGEDANVARYAINEMGWFNYNLPRMGYDAARIASWATQDEKRAFLYLMEQYSDLGNATLAGTGRLVKGMITDPANIFGIFTLGGSFLVGQSTKLATRAGLMELLKRSLVTGTVGAVNGFVYGGLDATGREIVHSEGADSAFRGSKVWQGSYKGAAAGAVLMGGGKATIGLGKSLFNRSAGEIGEKVLPKIDANMIGKQDLISTKAGLKEGVNVKVNDGKTKTPKKGKVLGDVKADGTVDVSIPYGKKGKTKVINIEAENLSVITTKKAPDTNEIKVENKAVNSDPKSAKEKLAQTLDTTPGEMRTGLQHLVAKINEVLPRSKSGKWEVSATRGGEDANIIQRNVGKFGGGQTQSMSILREMTEKILQPLKSAGALHPTQIRAYLYDAKLDAKQEQILKDTVNTLLNEYKTRYDTLVNELKNSSSKYTIKEINEMSKLSDELDELMMPLNDISTGIASQAGRTLQSNAAAKAAGSKVIGNQGLGNKTGGLTIQQVMRETGFDAGAATKEFWKLNEAIEKAVQRDANITRLRKAYDDFKSNGQFNEAAKARRLHDAEVARKKGELTDSFFGKVGGGINYAIRILNEIAISNVFSPTTLMINTIPSAAKMFYRPILNNIGADGLSWKAWKVGMGEMSAVKQLLFSGRKAAFQAFKYERSMLTGDSARFLETQTMIPKKFGGGIIRIFPRLLLATDALFEQVFYRSYIVGNATATAIELGVKNGLTKKQINIEIDKAVKKAVKDGYEPIPNAVDVITDNARDTNWLGRGFKDVDSYVESELKKFGDGKNTIINPNATENLTATNKKGRDYTQDALFKKDFDKYNSTTGAILAGYENLVNKAPVLRLMGQLFFRTPVRVFEEGLRLTPGLQLLHPNMRKNLLPETATSRAAHARAMGEVMLSQSLLGSAFGLYMSGNITGATGRDYKQSRAGEDAGFLPPYSIRNPITGDIFNYRTFDPFSTPLKIIVSIAEEQSMLDYRKAQGEFVGKEEEILKERLHISYMVMYRIIHDTNLFAGVSDILTLGEDLMNDDAGSEWLKFWGNKAKNVIPNTYFKALMQQHPLLASPENFGQVMRYRLNPTNKQDGSSWYELDNAKIDSALEKLGLEQWGAVQHQHTTLGDIRENPNPGGLLNLFDLLQPEELKERFPVTVYQGDNKKGKPVFTENYDLTVKKGVVMKFLWKLGKANDVNFIAPIKYDKLFPDVPNTKLKYTTANTRFPRETLYNRMQRYVKMSQGIPMGGDGATLIDMLHEIATDPEYTIGRPSAKGKFAGTALQATRKVLASYRDIAWTQIFEEEKWAESALLDKAITDANSTLGQNDPQGNTRGNAFNLPMGIQ